VSAWLLAACGSTPTQEPQADASQVPPPVVAAAPVGSDIATRNALFKVSTFDTLPGWQQDNLGEAWAAFKESCKALERKPNWKKLCADVKATKDPKAGRALLEREFTLLTVQNTDKTREGDITGYYEPLLNGRTVKGGDFVVPVYGVPNDMYFLDWKNVPTTQRKGVATMRPNGRLLVAAQPGELGAVKVDLRKFTLDTLDRRLRVRLEGDQGLPYYNRADIQRLGQIDAPVLAWVDDPLALYAMQIQGAGRIRMADGSTVRLQYADQNGQPFKPMQLAAQGNERIQTRGIQGAQMEVPETFELAPVGDAAEATDSAEPDAAEPLTRGGVRKAPAPNESDALVNALLPQGPKAANKGRSKSAPPAPPASEANPDATVAAVGRKLLAQRAKAIETDPSYVFFRVANDLPQNVGPMGALGVPLTAGRSLAVDPRVMPLGYPVFLDAQGTDRKQTRMQRLMFAQDTGGAIRGAVRADYFWGYGSDAGRQARQTKHRGRMWVMVPHAEVQALLSTKLVVRGSKAPDPECLVPDDDYCAAAQDAADLPESP
jgi:membrane-bound lytic murein transglycosylase A